MLSSLSKMLLSTLSSDATSTEVQVPTHRVSVVCISDTHGCHRELDIPDADILIHAGDFTRFGKEEDAKDFKWVFEFSSCFWKQRTSASTCVYLIHLSSDWLGELPHQHKIVVNGNHECNAMWKGKVDKMLFNATFLLNSEVTVTVRSVNIIIYGTQFFWPMKTSNPYYDVINGPLDILVCHGPVAGMVDDNSGCKMLRSTVERVKPKLVVSGHIHRAYGQCKSLEGTQFVNAANCANEYSIANPAVFVELDIPCSQEE